MTQEEIANLNPVLTKKKKKEIDLVIKQFPTNKCPDPRSFSGEFFLIFKEELISILHKLFQKI